MINLSPVQLEEVIDCLQVEHDNHVSDINPEDLPQAVHAEVYQEYVFDDYIVKVDENLRMEVYNESSATWSRNYLEPLSYPSVYAFFDLLVSDLRRHYSRDYVSLLRWEGK